MSSCFYMTWACFFGPTVQSMNDALKVVQTA